MVPLLMTGFLLFFISSHTNIILFFFFFFFEQNMRYQQLYQQTPLLQHSWDQGGFLHIPAECPEGDSQQLGCLSLWLPAQ